MVETKLTKDMIIKRRVVWNCRLLINRALTVDELMVFMPKNQVAIDELHLLWNMGWIHYEDNQKIRLTPLGLEGLRQSFPYFKFLPKIIPVQSMLDTLYGYTIYITHFECHNRTFYERYLKSYSFQNGTFEETENEDEAVRITDWRICKRIEKVFPTFTKSPFCGGAGA